MKKTFLILIILSALFYNANAQYSTSAGLRFGSFSGITVKHFIGGENAVEGLLTWYYNDGFVVTGLYEFQKPFPDIANLYWYIGGGLHAGFGRFDNDKHSPEYFVFGGDAIIGLEYCFQQVPFNLGFDWKPAVNFAGHYGYWPNGFGISFRYTFYKNQYSFNDKKRNIFI
jgi:hypothetical protein